MMSKSRLSFLILWMSLPLYLAGQAFTSLNGSVTDPSGAVVPNTTITIRNIETGVERQATSDAAGRYTFVQVIPGNYTLVAQASGFMAVTITRIELLVNAPATVPVVFEKIGAVSQSVQVEATSVQVNTQDASLGNAIGNQLVMTLPSFARNVTGLLSYQPGVTNFGGNPDAATGASLDDRDGSVNGGKSDQANVTLDGVDVNDQNARRLFSVLRATLDSVQEFRTTTSNGNPDSGRGSGADVALVTKNGTNAYHGSLYEYHRNTVTAANSFFNNAASVPRGALLINIFGASVGGPIRRNHTFFFVNYEGRRDASATGATRTVPTDTLRQGIVQFRNTSGQLVQLTPDQIKTIDPLGIGVNQAVLQLLQVYPHANDNSVSGADGLNIGGYRFNAPQRSAQNTYIVRFDHQVDSAGKHQLFLRGNLQNDHQPGTPQFPGMQQNSVTLGNNKGMAVGYTAVLRPNVVSTFRYGLTRQGGETTGILNSSYTYLRGFSTPYGVSTGTARIIPVHNITEDIGWTHGAHDVRFGALVRFVSNGSTSYGHSWNSALTNGSGLKSITDIKPSSLGVSQGDATTYNYAMTALLGLVTQGNGQYNYALDGSVFPAGAPVARHYKDEEYEAFGQDSWRITQNFTLTAGFRMALEPPVYEGNGYQVSADQSLGAWLDKRGGLAAQGISQAQAGTISYVLASSSQGRPLYPYHTNWSPRMGLAYSPHADSGLSKFLFGGSGKTSIRAGFGMYYDLIGQPLAQTYSNNAFGLSTSVGSPMNVLTASTAPRFTSFWSIPAGIVPPAPKGGFPAPAPNIFAVTGTIDDQLKAPYTMNMNLSIGREFSHRLFIQASYVGRLSRHSLIQRDLAMPTDLRDPKSGQTYFQAMTQLGTLMDLQKVSVANLPKIPFFENMWASAAAGALTATQVIGNTYSQQNQGDFTAVLNEMDEVCNPSGTLLNSRGDVSAVGCSVMGPNAMFNAQYAALSAWSSIGNGNYHAMQWSMRKSSDSLVFDLNYTFSKSIDLSSVSERSATFSGFVVNTWNPSQLRAVSNYDTTHQVNAQLSWAIPYGHGKRFGSNANRFLNAILGGWQIAAVYRQTSGLPMTISDGSRWATNWQLSVGATPNGNPLPPVTNTHNVVGQKGGPNLFSDPAAAVAAFSETMAGQSGVRNTIRGGGYFNIDTGVLKSFIMPYRDSHRVQIRWESFNLTNSVMFDPRSASNAIDNTAVFGRLSGQLGQPRQMQFALRYEF